MTTAGGLVFFGDDAGSLEAVEAADRPRSVAFQYRPVNARIPNELCG